MSIQKRIMELCQQRRLVRMKPYRSTDRDLRTLYLVAALDRTLRCSSDSDGDLERLANLEADLAEFVSSPTLYPGYIKKLSAPNRDVWEIRSVEPEPQMRVFGLFAATDTYIATNVEFRSDLGFKGSQLWESGMREARRNWQELFSGYTAKTTNDVSKLVSGVIQDEYND